MTAGAATLPRLASARPDIAVNGRASAVLADGLLRLLIREDTDGLCRCEATFGNWGAKDNRLAFLYFDRQLLDFGKELAVSIGGGPLFGGRITALEADYPIGSGPRLTVLAEDRYQDLRMTRRSRTFADITDAEVFRQVAGEHGLTADVQLPGPRHPVLAQLNQSDLAFLRDRARAIDAELWMEGTTLSARTRTARATSTLRLGWGNELREVTVLADLAGQCTSVTVGGWDLSAKQAIAETADAASIAGELDDGTSGSATLGAALARRNESVVHNVPLNSAEARSRAETVYRRMARRFVTARGVAETVSGLRTGNKVRMEGLGGPFSGAYYLTEVIHRFDDELGMRTEFRAERAWLGGAG